MRRLRKCNIRCRVPLRTFSGPCGRSSAVAEKFDTRESELPFWRELVGDLSLGPPARVLFLHGGLYFAQTGKGTLVGVRLQPDVLAGVDQYAAEHDVTGLDCMDKHQIIKGE